MIGDHLAHEPAARAFHQQHDAVAARAGIGAGAKFPCGVDLRHAHAPGLTTRRETGGAARRGEQSRAALAAVVGGHLHHHLAACHRRITFHLGAEVPHAAGDQRENAHVDHPHTQVHHAQRNASQRGPRHVGGDQRQQQVEWPPVEPLELGQLEWTPLAHLRVRPCIGVQQVGVRGVHDARAAHRHVHEQRNQQPDAESHVAEQV